jgi:hypothetical protein
MFFFFLFPVYCLLYTFSEGGVAERLKATVLKIVVGATLP